jgi:hypothetical protein
MRLNLNDERRQLDGSHLDMVFGVRPPARRASRGILHSATGTAVTVGAAAIIVAVLGVAAWEATMIVVGVVAVLVVLTAAWVLSRP